jgi:hypothetical protein
MIYSPHHVNNYQAGGKNDEIGLFKKIASPGFSEFTGFTGLFLLPVWGICAQLD